MSEPTFIQRKTPEQDSLHFESLKREGVRLAQQFSGKLWTDFNAHDPGVTILEQLCYGLTELAYQTNFDVVDYLAEENGVIDTVQQVLYRPEEIFTCRPTTTEDVMYAILDALPEIDTLWLNPAHQLTTSKVSQIQGLYHIMIRPHSFFQEYSKDLARINDLKDRVQKEYCKIRNLCEDLVSVDLAEEVELELRADIEIQSNWEPTDILSEIYDQCNQLLAQTVSRSTYEEMVQQQIPLEEVFCGPYTQRGVFGRGKSTFNEVLSLSSFYSAIQNIEGVKKIYTLSIEDEEKKAFEELYDPVAQKSWRLKIPQQLEEIKVNLSRNGRQFAVSFTAFKERYDHYQFLRTSLRNTKQETDWLYQLPRGTSVDAKPYHSIQHHFPDVYGINSYGIPASETLERKSQASQLKAYLMIFEQLMANFEENLHSVKDLFSLENEQKQSYFFQAMDNGVIPDGDSLYLESPKKILKNIYTKQDDYYDRKGRVLDYLLAIYGKKFTQQSLKRFNYYDQAMGNEAWMLNNKIQYLKSIVEVGKNRVAAFDYHQKFWRHQQLRGFELKLRLRLGMKILESYSLTLPILKQKVKIVPNEYVYHAGESPQQSIPLFPLKSQDVLPQLEKHWDVIPFLKNESLPELLLRKGIEINRYKIIPMSKTADIDVRITTKNGRTSHFKVIPCDETQEVEVVFTPENEQEWWHIGTFSDKQEATKTVNALCRFLVYLNVASEGFHLVEHILLRPLADGSHEDVENTEDFYSCRMSLIFPNWTTRCHDSQFQVFAEQIVRENSPAHVLPEIYWLDFKQMRRFEKLYLEWMTARQASKFKAKNCDQLSRRLIKFLCILKQSQKMREAS